MGLHDTVCSRAAIATARAHINTAIAVMVGCVCEERDRELSPLEAQARAARIRIASMRRGGHEEHPIHNSRSHANLLNRGSHGSNPGSGDRARAFQCTVSTPASPRQPPEHSACASRELRTLCLVCEPLTRGPSRTATTGHESSSAIVGDQIAGRL